MTTKMRNVPTELDGIKFASKKEANRWRELTLIQMASDPANPRPGDIRNLKRQVRIQLYIKDSTGAPVKWRVYVADAVYDEFDEQGQWPEIVEDVKGRRQGDQYNLFKMKRDALQITQGIRIREI